MWRRWLIGTVMLAALSAVAGCQTTGTWFEGGNFLSSLPFSGGAPMGQTEPELTVEPKPAAE
jgi:hypothetical protein